MARIKKTNSELLAEKLYKKYLYKPKKKSKPKVKSKEKSLSPKQKYRLYLKTAHWKSKRLEVLIRDNYTCTYCGSNTKLEVHHSSYKNRGNEKLEYLTTLCIPCHRR